MARTGKLSQERKAFINSLIEHYHPEDAQGMLEAEIDEKFGYSKYDYKNKGNDDSRNTGKETPMDFDKLIEYCIVLKMLKEEFYRR